MTGSRFWKLFCICIFLSFWSCLNNFILIPMVTTIARVATHTAAKYNNFFHKCHTEALRSFWEVKSPWFNFYSLQCTCLVCYYSRLNNKSQNPNTICDKIDIWEIEIGNGIEQHAVSKCFADCWGIFFLNCMIWKCHILNLMAGNGPWHNLS